MPDTGLILFNNTAETREEEEADLGKLATEFNQQGCHRLSKTTQNLCWCWWWTFRTHTVIQLVTQFIITIHFEQASLNVNKFI